MRAFLALSALSLLVSCAHPSGDPADVTYAESLGVDLAAMQQSPSGLYSQDRAVGTGAEALNWRVVTVHYTGWFPNGEMFDSSRDRSPFSFTLGRGQVIAGWDEGVRGMKVGGKRLLVIPSALGYGEQGQGPIPPYSVLVFEVELLAVN